MTYREIKNKLSTDIPKSTLSYWCRDIVMPDTYHEKVKTLNSQGLKDGREKVLAIRKLRKIARNELLRYKYRALKQLIYNDPKLAQASLGLLYLTEGAKNRSGGLMFGNSDPQIIQLFLRLLRKVFPINETKFRCTVQCRADQDIEKLDKFWSAVTKIPLGQFYKARIDQRTIGKPTRKIGYMGVCRIDYLSANVYNELQVIIELITEGYEGR